MFGDGRAEQVSQEHAGIYLTSEEILVQAYGFTSPPIAKALLEAQ